MKVVLVLLMLCLSLTSGARQTALSDSAILTMQQIAANNKFESAYVGFAGSPSQQFALMNILERVAKDRELLSLTHNKNAAVRIYAFIALCRKNRGMAGKAYKALNKDQATISTLNGCIGGQSSVASIIRQYYKAEE